MNGNGSKRPASKDPRLCSVAYCRHRAGKRAGGICYMHQKRNWRKENPMSAAFSGLKDRARARGIEFALPFDYFEAFALASNYLNNVGNGGDCLTIDRKNNLRGYVIGNIQPLTRRANVLKQFKRDERRMTARHGWQG